jgi:hypothetical protein
VVYTLAGKGGGNATAYVKRFGIDAAARHLRDMVAAASTRRTSCSLMPQGVAVVKPRPQGRVFRRTESLNDDARVHFADTPLQHARDTTESATRL